MTPGTVSNEVHINQNIVTTEHDTQKGLLTDEDNKIRWRSIRGEMKGKIDQ